MSEQIKSAVDPKVHATIVESKSPVSVDGYPLGSPKMLCCPHQECQASTFLDENQETPGWQDIDHSAECPYRTA